MHAIRFQDAGEGNRTQCIDGTPWDLYNQYGIAENHWMGMKDMRAEQVMEFKDRQAWRAWLQEHFQRADEAWLVFALKGAEDEQIGYQDAVEEALCFGWIDGQTLKQDAMHLLRRFTPRRKGSRYSRTNIERLLRLRGQGTLGPGVLEATREMRDAPFVFPNDILPAIRSDPAAWEHFCMFPESYRRIRIAHIESARKNPAEFEKRLSRFIEKTRENRLIAGDAGIRWENASAEEKGETSIRNI